jgi:streptogramin lyase
MRLLRYLFVVVMFFFANTALSATVEEPPEFLHNVPLVFQDGTLISTSFYGIAMDGDGNIFAVSSSRARVLKYDKDENFIDIFGLGFGSSDGQFNGPQNIAIDSAGNFYVSDRLNHRIQKFSNTGEFLLKWGSSGKLDGQFNQPHGIAVHPNGDVYVCDFFNARVQVFDSNGNFKFWWGGTSRYNGLRGIDFDEEGNVYTLEWGTSINRVTKSDLNGNFIENVYTFPGAAAPFALDVGPSGNIWVVSIAWFSTTPNIWKVSPDGILLSEWFTGDPRGIQESAEGYVYVGNGNDLKVYDATKTGSITAFDILPEEIDNGESVTISWDVSDANSCEALNGTEGWPGSSISLPTGQKELQINDPGCHTFTLQCTDGIRTFSASKNVNVINTDVFLADGFETPSNCVE